MLRVCKFQENKKALVPAVVHVDGTGRLQTVTREANGALYQLTKKFFEKTSVPIILNTSFNVAGEPIAETPQDALNTLLSTGLDFCVLGDQIVTKRKQILFESNEVPWPNRLKQEIDHALQNLKHEKESGNGKQTFTRYTGTFEHSPYGKVVIEANETGLQATLSDGLLVRSNIFSPLKPCLPDVFEIINGPMASHKIVFLPDRRKRVNVLAVLAENRPGKCQFFFRMPSPAGFDIVSYKPFVGTYAAADQRLNVSVKGADLCVSTSGQTPIALVMTNSTEFYPRRLPGYAIEFEMNCEGAMAEGAVVTLPNEIVVLKNVEHTAG